MTFNLSNTLKELDDQGIVVVPNVLKINEIKKLKDELSNAISEDKRNRPDVFDSGMVHNCMNRGENMAKLLDNPVMNICISEALSKTAIIYAYQSSSLRPKSGNYGSRIHVDCPRFIPGYYTNMGIIWPLNDFTCENGATYYLPRSHKSEEVPCEDEFYKSSKRAIAKSGDMIIINARLFHAAGYNNTNETRHALTLNFCRSFMRQRFDFPRLLSKEQIASLGENGKRLIGMNVRMPSSLEEFYLPEESRLYKSNQG